MEGGTPAIRIGVPLFTTNLHFFSTFVLLLSVIFLLTLSSFYVIRYDVARIGIKCFTDSTHFLYATCYQQHMVLLYLSYVLEMCWL